MTATPKAAQASINVTHTSVLAIALPIIASNVSTPLIGLVDTAVVGQLPAPHYIGAVALSSTIFTFLYWAFGFLRMGTTGLTAQADGAGDSVEVGAALGRALLIAAVAGSALILLQAPLSWFAFLMVEGSKAVEGEAHNYFAIRIWSAPAALANYALLGWFIGLGRARIALLLQVLLNGLNAILDAWFVLGLGWNVAGVALGTVIAEIAAAVVGLVIATRVLARIGGFPDFTAVLAPEHLRRAIAVNTDIMIRTLCLLTAFTWFVFQSAASGDVVLAANAVLMQFVSFMAYFLDGFAFAAESLVGRAIGARNRSQFDAAVRLSSLWAGLISLALGTALMLLGGTLIDLLTISPDVRAAARVYLHWAALVPVVGVVCFQLDGIFIGATRSVDMRNMALISLVVFMAAWAILHPAFGNDGLWLALIILNVTRAITLAARYRSLVDDAFPVERAARQAIPS
ncbi:DNA-damage-inducible protein F [Candidatus Filomicrobium marinum]|uniref:DNA-damage-inducible protein F n=2 Tax=Filomicrobium TaxID=119044 RepID=A0A0D6JFF0_9HYPH|nr:MULTISPECIES: MATE family efflux transporter [Filomicrobium]MCV0367817.1 MATE family efflux transporter [Filomicrobium sp.]CFX20278.1 DNA-damage-inducible protein F [Candidatus Filomicrobium marinum]CPR18632.1 DNA-damage-inducible protein F [Candidatus Filomicrobium marinum]SDO16139.1 multidrug resistance protein, MATE family [Filomicrobium insigne]